MFANAGSCASPGPSPSRSAGASPQSDSVSGVGATGVSILTLDCYLAKQSQLFIPFPFPFSPPLRSLSRSSKSLPLPLSSAGSCLPPPSIPPRTRTRIFSRLQRLLIQLRKARRTRTHTGVSIYSKMFSFYLICSNWCFLTFSHLIYLLLCSNLFQYTTIFSRF